MDRYSFLVTAMSISEAKSVMGFGVSSTPSAGDLSTRLRELRIKYHPDKHPEDPAKYTEMFQEVEAAYAVLTGKQRPSYDRRDPTPSPRNNPQPEYKPPPEVIVTFQEAKSKVSIPSGVEWKFVTTTQRGKGWSGGESSLFDYYYVAYGRNDKYHVFLGMNHYERADYYVGGSGREDRWTFQVFESAIKKDEGTQPAWLYRNVATSLKRLGFEGKFNAKVMDAKGWNLSERMPTGGKMSIKHWLVNSGEVAGDDASVSSRKQVIEARVDMKSKAAPGYYLVGKGPLQDHIKMTLVINGMAYDVPERGVQQFWRMRVRGKGLKDVLWDHNYWNNKKNITRLRDKRVAFLILDWMSKNFHLPDAAMKSLEAAAAQMNPEKK